VKKSARREHKRIAWIEDDAHIIEPVMRLVKTEYEVVSIGSMKEALERIDEILACHLIVLDVLMPARIKEYEGERHVGVHLLRRLREQGVTCPVLVFTVLGTEEVMEPLRELGMVRTLTKPVLPVKLLELVKDILAED
jgi:CheY-like chemotaxis protein